MSKKTILSFFLCIVFVFASVGSISAQSSQSAGLRPTKMVGADRPGKKAEDTFEKLKNKTKREIERRLKALNHLLTLIDKFQKVSPEQKTTLKAQVQQQITALTSLQSQLSSATDIEAVRTVKQSLIKDYRIFALFIPKIYIMVNAERLLTTIEKAEVFADNLGKRIDEEKASGKDVSALEALLISGRSHLSQSKTQAQNALNTVIPLTPEGYPGNKTELKKAREHLRLGHRELLAAWKDGKKIMDGLRIGTSPTPTAIPTTVMTPAPSL